MTRRLLIIGLLLTASTFISAQAPLIIDFNDCAEWIQGQGDPCGPGDPVKVYGGWTSAGQGDQIIAEANNPLGGPGMGFRHWRGYGSGTNGGGVRIDLPETVKEMWLRFYMRYQEGYEWDSLVQTKDLYVNVNHVSIFTVGFHGSDTFGPAQVSQPGGTISDHGPGWRSLMRRGRGDGKWRAYEIHVKMDTNGKNGISETWVDGKLAGRRTKIDWGNSEGWSFFVVGSNACCVANKTNVYNDFDDFAVSTTGYIGLLKTDDTATNPSTRQER